MGTTIHTRRRVLQRTRDATSVKKLDTLSDVVKTSGKPQSLKLINRSRSSSEAEESYLFANSRNKKNDCPTTSVRMNGEPVKVLIDSGANDDVIDETTYQQFSEKPVLQNARISLYSYNAKEPLDDF